VHGHVTQPLFVVGLFVPAYWLLWRESRTTLAPWRAHPWAHVIAGMILAVFLLPIVLDWTRGENSNLHDILRHLQFNGGDRKNPLAALLYLLSFLGYDDQQESLLTSLRWASLAFFRDHWLTYAGWAGLVALLVAGLRRGWFVPDTLLARWGQRAVGFWLWTAVLCVVWGIMQAGPMFAFNGYFYHALHYLLLLGAAALVVSWPALATSSRQLSTAFLATAFLGALFGFRLPGPDEGWDELAIGDSVQAALAADPEPGRPKLLSFNHRDWPQVAITALVLQRKGVPYYADENWNVMFQKEHIVPVAWLRAPQPPMAVWRFISRTKTAPGLRYSRDLNLMLSQAPLPPDGGDIDFSNTGNVGRYLSAGLASPEGDNSWTSQPDVLLQFRPVPADRDVEMEIVAAPFLPSNRIELQPTELRYNGHLLFSAPFTEPGVLRVRIPKELWNEHPVAALHLHFPKARAPWQVGVSGDVRILALAVKRLTTRLAETQRP
jgi:hypothetical protein